MFTLNQRVRHIASGMEGTVIAFRINPELFHEEVRILYDEHERISSWAPAIGYQEIK